MTYLEMRQHVEQYLDQNQTGYFYPSEMDKALNDALNERMGQLIKDFEVIQKVRDALRKLTVRQTFLSTNVVPLSATTDYMRAVALEAKWDFACNGKITKRTIAVKPIRFDLFASIQNDPDNQPTNHFPVYIDYNNDTLGEVMEIHSGTTPEEVVLTYIKRPQKIDSENNPIGVCELPEEEHYAIIKRACRILAGQIGDMNTYQQQITETQLQQ